MSAVVLVTKTEQLASQHRKSAAVVKVRSSGRT